MGTKKRFPQDHRPGPEATRLGTWVGLAANALPQACHACYPLKQPFCSRNLLLWAPLTQASETAASTPNRIRLGRSFVSYTATPSSSGWHPMVL